MNKKKFITKLFSYKTFLGLVLLGVVSIFFIYPVFVRSSNRIFCFVYSFLFWLAAFLFIKFKKNSSLEPKKMFVFLLTPFFLFQLLDILFLPDILSSTGYLLSDAILITKHFTVFGYHLQILVFLFVLFVLKKLSIFEYFQKEDLPDKMIKSFSKIFYFVIPFYVFLSILSKPIWQVFYGEGQFAVLVFSFQSLLQIVSFLFLFSHYFLIHSKSYKPFMISVSSCFFIKILFKSAFAYAFYNVGISSIFGIFLSSFLGYFVSSLLAFFFLFKKYHIDFELPLKSFFDILICVVLTSVVILFLRTFLVFPHNLRFTSLIEIIFYFPLSFTIYIYLTKQFGFTKLIFEK